MATLTSDQTEQLSRFMAAAALSEDQKDRLVAAYIAASLEERAVIQRVYFKLFTEQAFVQRITTLIVGSSTSNANTAAAAARRNGVVALPNEDEDDRSNAGAPGGAGAKGNSRRNGAQQQPAATAGRGGLTHKQKLLSKAVEDSFCKLEGPGPFTLELCTVRTDADAALAVELFASRFYYPGPSELRGIVRPRQASSSPVAPGGSTRSRRQRIGGDYCFAVRVPARGGELACAVAVTYHRTSTLKFVEMPLFATNVGYKRLGIARLLSCALQQFCCEVGAEMILASADPKAVPFWEHMGYSVATRQVKSRIEFEYSNNCHRFEGSTLMVWVADARCNWVQEGLRRMPEGKFLLAGPDALAID